MELKAIAMIALTKKLESLSMPSSIFQIICEGHQQSKCLALAAIVRVDLPTDDFYWRIKYSQNNMHVNRYTGNSRKPIKTFSAWTGES